MEAKSKQTYIRMPARKLRRVIDEVRGKNIDDAINILRFMPYFAARIVEKNLNCAIANAENIHGINSKDLIVSEIYADDGPIYKRIRPRAQGRVYKIFKRTSHLTVKVSINNKKEGK
jgi:large subunit ribosomal protein L22